MLTRLRRDVWNWLPAFVEIAEAGSIVAASRRLNLTPAAISRTLGLLEERLGEPLFNRVGRSLVLNPSGAMLRDAVRAANAQIDRGIGAVGGDPMVGVLRVSSVGVLTDHFVLPALIALKRAHPTLVPEHLVLHAAEANARLVRGEVDIAFYYEELSAADVVVERIGQTPMGVYCGRGHPLFARQRITRADVLAHPFSVPQIGDTGRVLDGWPADAARDVGMRITMLASNLQVCLSGLLVTVLPDVTARDHVKARKLRRLPFERLPPIEIFAARPSAGRRERAEAVLARMRAELSERVRA